MSTHDPIYLDYAATTPMFPAALDAMMPWLTSKYGNPSSLHLMGQAAKQAIEDARRNVARTLHCQPHEITWTSGGTASNNLTILGITRQHLNEHPETHPQKRHLITTQLEHDAVLNPFKQLETEGWQVTYLQPDADGFIPPQALIQAIQPNTLLASIIHGHNEIGTIQDLNALGKILKHHGILFHTDAMQTVGKIPIDLQDLPVDYLSFSGHKLSGPKGIGGLFIRESATLPTPITYGASQEHGLSPGTENVAGIIGLATALNESNHHLSSESKRLQGLQTRFLQQLQSLSDDLLNETGYQIRLNGSPNLTQRIPGNIHLSVTSLERNAELKPLQGEALVLQLALEGFCTSSGSACHSSQLEPSRIIKALGKSDAEAISTLRISMGHTTTATHIEKLLDALPRVIKRLAKRHQRKANNAKETFKA